MTSHASFSLSFEPENHCEFGPCGCCGELTKRVWGYVYQKEMALAAYFVEWTPRHEVREANFDLILGKWGDDTTAVDRECIAIAFRHIDTGPSFMVIDANTRQYASNDLAARALTRNEVLASLRKDQIFKILDVIFLEDPRLNELRG